jgi:hypothetical protein
MSGHDDRICTETGLAARREAGSAASASATSTGTKEVGRFNLMPAASFTRRRMKKPGR